ncbi:MAG: hypothetical protein NZO16_00310 [Deltaproteobacteria bacterium]|nr:hypothetical protein [Deltaproteobacteria bacterium]
MSEEKKSFAFNFEEQQDLSSTRAKNKTMMLSPEFTSKFRSQVLAELDEVEKSEEKTRKITLGKQNILKVPTFESSDLEPSEKQTVSTHEKSFEKPQDSTSLSFHTNREPSDPEDQGKRLASNTETSKSNTYASATSNCGQTISFSYYGKKGKLLGFLITYHFNEEGEFYPLYQGRVIVSNDLDGSRNANYMVIKDPSINPFHAIMKVSEGKILVLDQLSESGTEITKLSGEKVSLSGDKAEIECKEKVKFGDVEFVALLI